MPLSPPDAALQIRSAANTNCAALNSVDAQITAHKTEVESWPNTPAKGRMLDALDRLRAATRQLKTRMAETVRMSNMVLEMFNQVGDPDPPQPPIVWSTGSW